MTSAIAGALPLPVNTAVAVAAATTGMLAPMSSPSVAAALAVTD
jgi:hypothetical protein